jgi:hypothetical protein
LDGSELTIINAYAPRGSRDRALLWKKINEVKFNSDHVVLGGDFNHLVEINYRGRAGERRMHRRESASWHHLTLQYELMDSWFLDSFRKMSGKSYTFDNRRAGPRAAVSTNSSYRRSSTREEGGSKPLPP